MPKPHASSRACSEASSGAVSDAPGPGSVWIDVETPVGAARARVHPVERPRAVLMLGHGAGGGIDAPDLSAATEAALGLGVAVVLVEQPYRVAGRRSPAPARQLDAAWVAVAAALRGGPGGAGAEAGFAGVEVWVMGGRSSGARVACRTADAVGAAAVLCLAFPLHPPGRAEDPAKSRLGELEAVSVPVLVVQGERDPFGMPPAAPGRDVVVVPGTHALRGRAAVREAVALWLADRV